MKLEEPCRKEDNYLNTNEIINDYQFHFQMIVERRKMDFEYENEI
jgi:hypothetical protein